MSYKTLTKGSILIYTGTGNQTDREFAFKLDLDLNDTVILEDFKNIWGTTLYKIIVKSNVDPKVRNAMWFTSESFRMYEKPVEPMRILKA